MSVSDKRGLVVPIYKPGTQEIQANLDFIGRPWLKKKKCERGRRDISARGWGGGGGADACC